MKNSSSVSDHPFLARVAASRFFTVSLVIHVVIVLLLGSAVLFHAEIEIPDFASGSDGFLSDSVEITAAPPSLPPAIPAPAQDYLPSSPSMSNSAITAATDQPVRFAVAPSASIPTIGVGDSMKDAMVSVNSGNLENLGNALQGGIGGLRKGSIFGQTIEASKLGVILDFSGSAHPHLAGAIEEIQKTFPDAVIILYPGCGILAESRGDSSHEIRKLSSISKSEREVKSKSTATTPFLLEKALTINEFSRLTKRGVNRETLFISWYPEPPETGRGNDRSNKIELNGHTEVAFEYLIDQDMDTIYWFADFNDPVDQNVAAKLIKHLKRKKITVHLNDFSGGNIPTGASAFAKETGGSVTSAKAK